MNSPRDVQVAKAKIESEKVKVKKERGSKKKEDSAPAKTKRQKITVEDEKVLAWMKAQPTDKAINSTVVRDAFSLPNRAAARRVLRSLATAGKAQVIEHGESKRKTYNYKVVA